MEGQADLPRSARVGWTGAILVALSATVFSAKAIFVKLAYADSSGGVSVDPVTLLAMRMGLSLPLFAIIGWWSSRNALQAINRRDWIALIIIGLMGN